MNDFEFLNSLAEHGAAPECIKQITDRFWKARETLDTEAASEMVTWQHNNIDHVREIPNKYGIFSDTDAIQWLSTAIKPNEYYDEMFQMTRDLYLKYRSWGGDILVSLGCAQHEAQEIWEEQHQDVVDAKFYEAAAMYPVKETADLLIDEYKAARKAGFPPEAAMNAALAIASIVDTFKKFGGKDVHLDEDV